MRIDWEKFKLRLLQIGLICLLLAALIVGTDQIWLAGQREEYLLGLYLIASGCTLWLILVVLILEINEKIKGE